jgi:hypothetical protein
MTRITAITICRQGASLRDSSLDGRSPWAVMRYMPKAGILRNHNYLLAEKANKA